MPTLGKILAGVKEPGPTRVYYLDWLRVFAMLAVFLYHCNRFFNSGDWHVKNGQLSQISSMFENVLGVWIMPFLFVLSGAAVVYSLKSRSGKQFTKERLLRILVPLVVLGMFVLGPPQIYLERLTHAEFSGNFWQFLPHYFDGLYGFDGNFAWMGVHLWYLLQLFLFSLIFLRLFLPSKNGNPSPLTSLARFFDKPWALFLLFFPLFLSNKLADVVGLGITRQMGSWDMLSYMLFFLYGYMLFANPRISDSLRKYCFMWLGLAAAAVIVWMYIRYAVQINPNDGFFFKDELRQLGSWFGIMGFLGLGGRYLNSNPRWLSHTNEAVLPFYILHQPIILAVGYFVVQWSWPIFAKYAVIAILSFVAIMAVYELVVRHIKVLRFLFGMKWSKK